MRLDAAKVAMRDGRIIITNPDHHARWDDIETLLDLVDAQAKRLTLLEKQAAAWNAEADRYLAQRDELQIEVERLRRAP